MYYLSDIRDIHLELTSKCNARCPMCSRTKLISEGKENLLRDEITIDLFKKWFSVDFVKQLTSLRMCGNLGDAVMARDTVEVFQYLRENNPNIMLSLFTNGGARDDSWWKKLAENKVKVIFAIDGLEDTNKLYRINTVWEKIMHNAKIFIDAGGTASWYMLVFKHNEHQVEECRALAASMGFKKFEPKHTTRFHGTSNLPVYDSNGTYTHTLEATTYSEILNDKEKQIDKTTITCKAQQKNSMYISANGVISPCCWLESSTKPSYKYRDEYISKIGSFYSLHDYTLQEIFNKGFLDKIKQTWSDTPLKPCKEQCSNFKKCESQFIERQAKTTI
jgi:MoaA/NifB/PqqE/SkfB family radical SAM enzyme